MKVDCRSTALAGLVLILGADTSGAAVPDEGKALLNKYCSRCHATTASSTSALKKAPNLWIVLRSYPRERLEVELAEGIGSRHRDMPQVQFSAEEIERIEHYLYERRD